MNSSTLLQLLSLSALLATLVTTYYVYPEIKRANGTLPVLQYIMGTMIIETAWALCTLYTAFARTEVLPHGGLPLAISLFARLKPALFAIGGMVMLYRLKHGKYTHVVIEEHA